MTGRVSRARALAGALAWCSGLAATCVARDARGDVVVAEPVAPIDAPRPDSAVEGDVQVVLQVVVDGNGDVESAVAVSRAPAGAPEAFANAAILAVKAAKFAPSTRDGRPIRARIEYVVVFRAPPSAPSGAPTTPVATPPAPPRAPVAPIAIDAQDEDYVAVRGAGWSSPRGLGDVRIDRELLEASPRQKTSELLSAAPGFFVDHEDGEGLGNDVYLRGFDLEHGAGIEMRVGSIPLNAPLHVNGQGYVDANFIIPEVVRSVRVIEGPFDPRQGDAAIVGSAYFDMGVDERGYRVKTTYGSFGQARVVGVVAPREMDDETFAAFALRRTGGFGVNRASQSASAIAQYGVDLTPRDRLRLTATAYGARATLPGVVRQDDLDAGRISLDGTYPNYATGQGLATTRLLVGLDFDHTAENGVRFELAPWVTATTFQSRQNFTGNLEASQLVPSIAARGDLFQSSNAETAAGFTSRVHTTPARLGDHVQVVVEPGVAVRAGHSKEARNLLDPTTLAAWDRRTDVALDTLDAGAYFDVDARFFERLRLSGGLRSDFLVVGTNDRLFGVAPSAAQQPGALTGSQRTATGTALSPRATLEYPLTPWLTPAISYGEGFRSLPTDRLADGAGHAYSKVRGAEAGARVRLLGDRVVGSVAAFETWIENELVFAAEAGGLETEGASTRRGVVASVVTKPLRGLLVSSALSYTHARFDTLVSGVSHDVPNVPPIVFRTDANLRGTLATLGATALSGRVGAGYTYLSPRHLADDVRGKAQHVLNASASLRYAFVEVGVEAYNVLGLRYADDAQVYVSNWSLRPGQNAASTATHLTAAPPTTVLGTLALDL